MSRATPTAALQSVLAAEHAVVFGYGVVGARLHGSARERAVDGYDRHRRVRDELVELISARGTTPVAAEPTYVLPAEVGDPRDARALATLLEERLAGAWADAVAGTTGRLRLRCARGLRDAAVAAAAWRGGSVAFPGLPER